MNIKILDCTLRDGGYINDWRFSKECIKQTISKLETANIDIIEVGFLDESKPSYNDDYTVFKNVEKADFHIKNANINSSTNCVLMIMHGKYNVYNLLPSCESRITGIRYCFKKEYIDKALENCKIIIEKGYKLYLQPAALSDYDDTELIYLIQQSNKLYMEAFYIVDTFGVMRQSDVLRFFFMVDNNLRKDVPIGFHSHNNLQLSFSNSLALINVIGKRSLFIDSSVLGMGRGAGNLCTELITQYINENIEGKYNLIPIIELMDEYILPIQSQHAWGYAAPYYIAAINDCHPNYAIYLMNFQTICIQDINNIIKSIPEEAKHVYDSKLVNQLYLNYQQHYVDDTLIKNKLCEVCKERAVLILAPGKSLSTYNKRIDDYISSKDPIVFSVNHIPENHAYNYVFLSNLKRFKSIDNAVSVIHDKVIFTSNITTDSKYMVVNYSSYLNENDAILDNSGLMLINLFKSIGVTSIVLAGFDGYLLSENRNYYNDNMVNNIQYEKQMKINQAIIEYFFNIRKMVDIIFLTPTIYNGDASNE